MRAALMPQWAAGSNLLDRIRGEMDETINRLIGPLAAGNGTTEGFVWAPSVDVEETDKAIVVKADLPGVEAKDIEVTVQNGSLILRGEKKEQREEKGKNYHRVERFAGAFYRAVPLPTDADAAGVTAATSKGVVTVTVPKKPGAQPQKIAVQSKD